LFPLVALATAAGLLSLGLAVLTSWALMTTFLHILETETEGHGRRPKTVSNMDHLPSMPALLPK
jgi:hypothetical protein